MAKTILELIRERKAVLKGNQAELKRTQALSVAAITAGVGKADWKKYMDQFGEITPLDPDQLKRLTAEDGTLGNFEFDKKRAYLVANGVCTMASPETQNLDLSVDTIDNGMAEAVCDPNVVVFRTQRCTW